MFLGILAGGAAFIYAQQILREKGPLQQTTSITIKRGMGAASIAAKLEKHGIISDARLFRIATLVNRKQHGSLKAGDYQFEAGVSMNEVLNKIQSGKILSYKVSLPEGWTTQMILDRLRTNEFLKGEITLDPAEGELLPDTYVFRRGDTRDDIIKRMMVAQTRLLDELWDTRAENLPVKTRKEVINLASIVEKETGVSTERPRVAAVFINRLKRKIRLQSDPTIIYGITGGKKKLDRPIYKKDINRKTAYNTYQIDGLPPTPIANPGRASIKAVLNPANTDDLFFVADGTGGHAFASTLKQHQKNVLKWRKIQKQRKAAEKSGKANKTDAPVPVTASQLPPPLKN